MRPINRKQMGQLRAALLTQIQQMRAGAVLVGEAEGTIDELKALFVEIEGDEAELDGAF